MRTFAMAAMISFLSIETASADIVAGSLSSFDAGLAHPISGLDHVTAMLAVGMLAASKGGRALWLWPLSFVGMMVIGGALGFAHVHLPYLELGISASVVILGIMVAFFIIPKLWAGAAVIGGFAILHGHAHVSEIPHSASGFAFALGFSVATGFLHLVGIGLTKGWRAIARSPTGAVGHFFENLPRKRL